jgi:phosphoenolpyruvate carboxykinase (ATP)
MVMVQDPIFGFEIPKSLDKVPADLLNPRNAWADKAAYDATRLKLGGMFKKNYEKYISDDHTDYSPHGPRV